jgi:hypothetical protein
MLVMRFSLRCRRCSTDVPNRPAIDSYPETGITRRIHIYQHNTYGGTQEYFSQRPVTTGIMRLIHTYISSAGTVCVWGGGGRGVCVCLCVCGCVCPGVGL